MLKRWLYQACPTCHGSLYYDVEDKNYYCIMCAKRYYPKTDLPLVYVKGQKLESATS